MKRIQTLLLLVCVALCGVMVGLDVAAQVDIPVTTLVGPYPTGSTLNATQCAVNVVRATNEETYQFAPSSRDVLVFKPYKTIVGATLQIDSVPSPTGRFGDVVLTPQSAGFWEFFYIEDGAGFVNSATTKVHIRAASGMEIGVLRPGSMIQRWNKTVRTNGDGDVYVPQMAPIGPHPTDLSLDSAETVSSCLLTMGGSEGNLHLTGREIFMASPSSAATSVTFTVAGVTDAYNRIQDLSFSASGDECTSLFACWLGDWSGFATSASAEVAVEQGGAYIGAVRIPPDGGLTSRLP